MPGKISKKTPKVTKASKSVPVQSPESAPKITRAPQMPPAEPKANESAGAINIQRISERRLLDQKLMRSEEPKGTSWGGIILVLLILLAGGVFFGYYVLSKKNLPSSSTSEIIVPKKEGGSYGEQNPAAATSPQSNITPPAAVPPKQILILNTPTGSLNVRKGASTGYQKIGEVKPGEIYTFVAQDQDSGWYQIKYTSTTTGWITKQYAKVK